MNKNKLYFDRDKLECDVKIDNTLSLSNILDDIISSELISTNCSKVSSQYMINLIMRDYMLDKDSAYYIMVLIRYYLPRVFKD